MKKIKRFIVIMTMFISGGLMVVLECPTWGYIIHGLISGSLVHFDWLFEDKD